MKILDTDILTLFFHGHRRVVAHHQRESDEVVPASADLERLPLSTRTRKCLKKESLSSTEDLRLDSLGQLLEIPAFGVTSLVDLLTAVEGAMWATDI